jgi:DNA-binding CsgD family transcriptional regulator
MNVFERAGDLNSAILCLDHFADVAMRVGDAEYAAWCIGAVDGVLHREGLARRESAPGDHESRVSRLVDQLGATTYRQRHVAGSALDPRAAFTEAVGWIPPAKSPAEISVVTKPQVPLPPAAETLSKRELDVLLLMAEGLTNQEIADRLFVSFRTVTTHVTAILGKLGLSSRTAAVAYAIRNGLA